MGVGMSKSGNTAFVTLDPLPNEGEACEQSAVYPWAPRIHLDLFIVGIPPPSLFPVGEKAYLWKLKGVF